MLRDKNTDADGLCDDERMYFLGDANFNVTTLIDTAGDAMERYLYEPYGALSVMDGGFGNRSATSFANLCTFTGRIYDPEAGLYYYRSRYYFCLLGRFLGRDPIGYWGNSYNLNQYAGGRVLSLLDPFGLAPVLPDEDLSTWDRPTGIEVCGVLYEQDSPQHLGEQVLPTILGCNERSAATRKSRLQGPVVMCLLPRKNHARIR